MTNKWSEAATSELQSAVGALVDNKAVNIEVLDLRDVSEATDFFVIASGNSDVHVRSLSEHVMEELGKLGYRPHHVEGMNSGRWVLLDFVDFVVHVFHPTLREFYQLENLWSDAPVLFSGTHG